MGGEKPSVPGSHRWYAGSPPRGRGKVDAPRPRIGAIGITPAWAGKSRLVRIEPERRGDHPRVGGEKSVCRPAPYLERGSPPRGRGKGGQQTSQRGGAQDHPRVGGEKCDAPPIVPAEQGSPPRGRGKGVARNRRILLGGITPAWAGKRLKRSHRSGIFISGPIPFHSVLHRPAGSGGSRAGRDGAPAGQPQNAGPA